MFEQHLAHTHTHTHWCINGLLNPAMPPPAVCTVWPNSETLWMGPRFPKLVITSTFYRVIFCLCSKQDAGV